MPYSKVFSKSYVHGDPMTAVDLAWRMMVMGMVLDLPLLSVNALVAKLI